MARHKLPGLALAVVRGEEVLLAEGFGHASSGTRKGTAKTPVEAGTFFELASLSKAFTALCILRLEEKGMLRLQDPVRQHLPWFTVNYLDEPVEITVQQLLHHSSGIPFASLARVPEAEDAGALRRTVETLVGEELYHRPGEKFLYVTINYDVLGLILEQICQQPFEELLAQQVLEPLGLKQTRAGRQGLPENRIAQGHKLAFLRPVAYDPPIYRGNVPAAYVLSTADDLARWLQIQLGQVQIPTFPRELIQRAWQPDPGLPPQDEDRSYGMGWEIDTRSGLLCHAGSNPTFSAFLLLDPANGLGIAMAANLGGAPLEAMAENLRTLLEGETVTRVSPTTERRLDRAASIATAGVVLVSAAIAARLFSQVLEIRMVPSTAVLLTTQITTVAIALVAVGLLVYATGRIPQVFLGGLNWRVVSVWAPSSLVVAVLSGLFLIALITLHIVLGLLFPLECHAR